jgi:hypothetical protein
VVDTFGFILYRRPFHLLEDRGTFSNKLLGLNDRWHLLGSPWSLHVELTTEDDHDLFMDPVHGAWQNAVWVWGAAVPGIGPEGGLDVQLDVVHNGPIVASHSRFTSGLTVDGRPLGSPLGPEASGVRGAVALTGAVHRIELEGAWERYSGDDYDDDPETGRGRVRVADNPDEGRLRLEVRWVGGLGIEGWSTRARLGAGRISRLDFGAGERTTGWGEVGMAFRW